MRSIGLKQGANKTRSDPEPWILLGDIALNENRMAEAELDFAKANQLSGAIQERRPQAAAPAELLTHMASAAERRENWSLAEHCLDEYLKSVPDDVLARERLARSKFWQGMTEKGSEAKVKEAYDDLKKASQVDQENMWPTRNTPSRKCCRRPRS